MASIRELKRKIKSVKSTQQITKAMKLVSAARLNKAQERVLLSRPFAQKMAGLLHELAFLLHRDNPEEKISHPLLEKRESPRVDLVLVTADRGLCGGFNTNLIRRAVQVMKAGAGKEFHLWLIGKKGRDYFRRFKVKIEKEYVGIFNRLGYHQAEIIGEDLMKSYLSANSSEVVVIYNQFKSRLHQELTQVTLLPVQPIIGVEPELDFVYEPSREDLVAELLPRNIKAQIYRILLESSSAELAARMAAMENATANAGELIQDLTLTMNKARQASITRELNEIVGGADALQSA